VPKKIGWVFREGKPVRKNGSTVADVPSLEADLNNLKVCTQLDSTCLFPQPTHHMLTPCSVSPKLVNVDNLSKKILYTRLKRQSPDLIAHLCFQDLRDSDEPIQLTRLENKISSQKSLAEMIKQTVSKLLIQLQPHSVDHVRSQVREALSSAPEFRDHKRPSSGQQSLPRARSSQPSGSEDDAELLGDDLDEAVARELADLEGRSNGAGATDAESNASADDDDDHDDDDDDDEGTKTEASDEDGSLSGYSSSSAQPALVKRAKLSSKLKPNARPSSSTFLPALNVGYTLGDSDASDVDIDDLAVDKMERERGRKNRRGQQARRASVSFYYSLARKYIHRYEIDVVFGRFFGWICRIWEKKYGKSAKHLVKLKQNHVPKQQKPGESHRSKAAGAPRNSYTGKRNDNGGQPTGSNTEPIAATKGAADPKLHPSWIAKQNQLKNLSLLKPAGKKITFD
jgi:hypothetical protein